MLSGKTETDLGALRRSIPASDECRKEGLIATWRDPEKVDDWDLVLEGFPKPSIVCRVRIVAHEGVVHHLIAVENLQNPCWAWLLAGECMETALFCTLPCFEQNPESSPRIFIENLTPCRSSTCRPSTIELRRCPILVRQMLLS